MLHPVNSQHCGQRSHGKVLVLRLPCIGPALEYALHLRGITAFTRIRNAERSTINSSKYATRVPRSSCPSKVS